MGGKLCKNLINLRHNNIILTNVNIIALMNTPSSLSTISTVLCPLDILTPGEESSGCRVSDSVSLFSTMLSSMMLIWIQERDCPVTKENVLGRPV